MLERTSTWSNIGTEVREAKDMNTVLKMSNLDYDVIKKPVFLPTITTELTDPSIRPVSFNQIPNRFATVRENDGHVYDVVSNRYEIIQNRDAFDFVNYMQDDISFEKAGETASGMVYIIAKMEEVNILGDAFTPYVIFRNGFNGLTRITAAICPLRIVCQNQFNFAFKNTENKITIKHNSNAYAKLEDAKHSLKMVADYMVTLNEKAEKYAGMKLDKFKVNSVLNELFPVNNEDLTEYKKTLLREQKMKFIEAYEADDNYHFRGSAWGIINAYTDFITHAEPRSKKSTRFENQFIRSIDNNMNLVLNIVDEYESVAI